MKILSIAPTPFFADRGTHMRILEEARALERRGHSVTIATYHIGRDIGHEVKTSIDVRRIRRLLFWYKKLEAGPDWQKIILDLMLVRKVFTLARTSRPDILHAHLHEGVLIGWVVQKLLFWRKMKLVADFHGSLTREMESHQYLRLGFLKIFFRRIERWINTLGDVAIASSPENAAEISAQANRAVETLPDGVNLEYFELLPDKATLRKELELPEDAVIVVYAGALIPNKGIAYLYEALKIILDRFPEMFAIVGGYPTEELERFVNNNHLEGRIRIVNPLNYFEVPKLLSACDIGIDPKDNFTRQASGKMLQYMGAGLAIACFGRENNRQYLDGNAAYADDISGAALADSITQLVVNEQFRLACGRGNRKRAREFHWNRAGETLERLYQK